MNEFVPRMEAITSDRIGAARAASAIAPVQPLSPAADMAGGTGVGGDGGEQARREHMASAFDYARVHARIADILAEMEATKADITASRETASERIEALRPQPVVIIPLPPASVETIERAVRLARDMAEQANLTRAAQANVQGGTVDQLMAMPA